MIVVRITMNAIPEKQLEVKQTLLSLIEPTAKEKGCKGYAAFCDIEDKNRFSLIEEWETRENLNDHIMSHRFGVLLGIKALLCDPMEIQIYIVSQSEGTEAIHSVRQKKSHAFHFDAQRSNIE